jgi:hypothetical protein
VPRLFPFEYLSDCSETSLQNFQMAQLDVAANLRKVLRTELERLIDALTNAEIARMLTENRAELARMAQLRQGVLDFGAPSIGELPSKPGPASSETFYRRKTA